MLAIDERLENILIDHNIIGANGIESVIGYLKNFRSHLKESDIIGLYGASNNADMLLHFMEKVIGEVTINYCFDRTPMAYKYKKFIKDPETRPIESLNELQVDYMLIGSFDYHKEFVKNLKDAGFQGVIIDLFEVMSEYFEEHMSNYKVIYDEKKRFKNSEGEERIAAHKRLIREYLMIRDFKSAFQYIDLYIENKAEDADNYKKLKRELQELLDEIKDCIGARQYNDIIINWVDAVPYMHLQQFPFLAEKAKKGINFEHFYTVNPWTSETMKTILYGEYSIESKLFLREEFQTEDTKFLRMLADEGYRFAYLGMSKYAKFFDDQTITVSELDFTKDASSIPRQWEMLNLLCNVEQPICILVHTLYETHEPYICGEIEPYQKFACVEVDWEREDCQLQATISSRYMDDQFAFYDNILGKSITKIYMSDHGRITDSVMRESRVHTIFIIDAPEAEAVAVKKIVSLIDFYKIIERCIHKKYSFQDLERDYAIVEAFDYYALPLIKMLLTNPRYKKQEGLQRRGIITLADRYCRFASGNECYFVSGDDKTNRIDEKEYAGRIAELRARCGDEFIDISQYDKFKFSRLLYDEKMLDGK